MIKITLNELQNNIDKYIEIAESETIDVYNNNKLLFSMVPKNKNVEKAKSFFGMLPEGATIGVDPFERG